MRPGLIRTGLPSYGPQLGNLQQCLHPAWSAVSPADWLHSHFLDWSLLRAESCASKLLSNAPHPPVLSLGCGDNIHLFSFPQPRNLSPGCLPCPGEASPELWSVKLYGAAKTCKVRAGWPQWPQGQHSLSGESPASWELKMEPASTHNICSCTKKYSDSSSDDIMIVHAIVILMFCMLQDPAGVVARGAGWPGHGEHRGPPRPPLPPRPLAQLPGPGRPGRAGVTL